MNNYPRKFDERRKTPRPPRVPIPLDQRPENRNPLRGRVTAVEVVVIVLLVVLVALVVRALL